MKKIALTKGMTALVSNKDFAYLSQFKWYAHKCKGAFYAASRQASPEGKIVLMHLLISTPPEGCDVDHKNTNSLDNRRSNLRPATRSQNNYNRPRLRRGISGYRGVCWNKTSRAWQARIKVNKLPIHLGVFKSAKDAAKAYDRAAKKYHKEFASLNFPRNK